jgi:membrane fusion protein (multidrug efflux system)
MTETLVERRTIFIPSTDRLRARFKRLAFSWLVLVVGLTGGYYGYNWWTVSRFLESTDDAYVGGNVTAISPHVAGFVSQILVADNQFVHAGQLIIRLDDRDFQATLERAEAIIHQREAMFASLQAKHTLQQSTIRQVDADLAAKRARATFASEEDARYQRLALTSAGSWQNAQRARAAEQEAQAAVRSSQSALEAAQQQVAVLDAEIDESRAAVAQAQADLQTARLNLGYTEVRSPIDGYIGNRAVRAGAYIAQGAYLVSIIPAGDLWVDANFKEDQLTRMTPGQPATVLADVMPSHVFNGHVLSLAPGTGAIFSVIPPENATGNFTKIVQRVPVRIELDSDPLLSNLRPGLSTTVTVDTRSGSNGVR